MYWFANVLFLGAGLTGVGAGVCAALWLRDTDGSPNRRWYTVAMFVCGALGAALVSAAMYYRS